MHPKSQTLHHQHTLDILTCQVCKVHHGCLVMRLPMDVHILAADRLALEHVLATYIHVTAHARLDIQSRSALTTVPLELTPS